MNFTKVAEIANAIFEADCMSKSKKQNNVFCRFAISNFLYRNVKGATYQSIGDNLGKDHATIMHYVNRHDYDLKFSFEYKKKYNLLCAELIEMTVEIEDWDLINCNIEKKVEGQKIFFHVEGKHKKIFAIDFSPKQLRKIADYIERKNLSNK